MFDPCCPEELALLEQIRNLNQQIVDNQVTQIADNVTVINNQYQNIIQNAQNTYNNAFSSSTNAYFQNQLFWTGEPKSMGQDVPDTTFTSSSEDDGDTMTASREDTLCAAIRGFMDYVIFMHTQNVNLAAASGAAAIAAGLALAGATVGISAAVGFGTAVLTGITANIWNTAVNDKSAQRKVACCMYDGLKDAPIDLASFKVAIQDCGFENNTNESLIAANIYNEMQTERNFMAFCRSLQENAQHGNSQDCMCFCDDDIVLYDYYPHGIIITPMGECVYKFYQPNPVYEEPAIEVPRYYFSAKDIGARCLKWENSDNPLYPTQATSDYWITNCEGVEGNGVGGFEGASYKQVRWRGGQTQYYKVTLDESEE